MRAASRAALAAHTTSIPSAPNAAVPAGISRTMTRGDRVPAASRRSRRSISTTARSRAAGVMRSLAAFADDQP
jgi:hypothetical protein